MDTINEITATYQHIAEEGRSELNKVQNKIYRIGSLRLLLFVAGIAGVIYFWSSGWIVLTGIIAVTLLPFILLIKYHNRLFHRKDYLEKKIAINEQELSALIMTHPLLKMEQNLSIRHTCTVMTWMYLVHIPFFSI